MTDSETSRSTEQREELIDWNNLNVPADAVFVHLADANDNIVTLSPGGPVNADGNYRLPSVYDYRGYPMERFAIEFADGEVLKRDGYEDMEVPNYES